MTIAQKSKLSKLVTAKRIEKRFCEFFAGIGLVREGLLDTGWECVYANDNDPKKQEQYVARFESDHFHLEDVWQTKEILSQIKTSPVLATASFPCVDLSLAGHWRGFKGKHSSTFFGFASVIAAMKRRQPKLIMLENVAGFLTSHEGKDFASVATTLADLGYYVDAFILDAKYFVPQSRVRVFVIGVHKSVIGRCDVIQSENGALDPWKSAVGTGSLIRPSRLIRLCEQIDLETGWIATTTQQPSVQSSHLREFIDLDKDQEWWDKAAVDKHYQSMSDIHKEQVAELRADRKSVHVGTIFRRKRYGTTRAEIRFDGLAGCLRVPRGGSARQIVIVIENGLLRIRWMSPREYARLQGAPDFPLVGRASQQMAGFGDAVCVPVISWIDRHVLSPLYESIA